jgi:hypothetical protein
MSIKYQIVKNDLKTGSDASYIPRTILTGTISGDELINALCWGSTLTPADCRAFLTNLDRVIEDQLTGGFAVDIGFLKIKPSIKGVFYEPNERFSTEKHWIHIKAQVSKKMRTKVSLRSNPIKTENRKPLPQIISFYNYSLEHTENIRTGDMVELKGRRLDFERENPELGVFLVSVDGTKVAVSEFANLSSTRLVFKVPNFPNPNEFSHFEVRRVFGKEVRTGSFNEKIQFLE